MKEKVFNESGSNQKKKWYEGPYNNNASGFVILYSEKSLVKPFFEQITQEKSKFVSPADVVIPYHPNNG